MSKIFFVVVESAVSRDMILVNKLRTWSALDIHQTLIQMYRLEVVKIFPIQGNQLTIF